MKWFGHVATMGEERISRLILNWSPEGKRIWVGPRLNWIKTVGRSWIV